MGTEVRKVVRSVLLRLPPVYEALTSQRRYLVYHRLGIVHEPDFRAFPLLVSRPDPVVLDIGGNEGQSILSIKTVLPNARITTFEPAGRHEEKLQDLATRMGGVRIETCALSDTDGEAEIFWPVYRGRAMHALASLDPHEVMSWIIPERVYGYEPDRVSIESERIDVRRLDSFDLEPDILKIDVQGTEARVLRGALATIEHSRPVVMSEDLIEDSESHGLLKPLGYDVVTFRKGTFERGSTAPATNRFLIPSERVPDVVSRTESRGRVH